jgi:hypothetical protein
LKAVFFALLYYLYRISDHGFLPVQKQQGKTYIASALGAAPGGFLRRSSDKIKVLIAIDSVGGIIPIAADAGRTAEGAAERLELIGRLPPAGNAIREAILIAGDGLGIG